MLVGVDASDSLVETIRGQRLLAAAGRAAASARCSSSASRRSAVGAVVGLDEANAEGNVPGLAQLLFSRYVFAFEVTSALLITAAIGAMVLAHRERLTPKPTQADLAQQRMRDYAEHGKHLGPLPSPGVFARHNAVDTPALLPDGTPVGAVGLAGARGPRHACQSAAGAGRRRRGAHRRPRCPTREGTTR